MGEVYPSQIVSSLRQRLTRLTHIRTIHRAFQGMPCKVLKANGFLSGCWKATVNFGGLPGNYREIINNQADTNVGLEGRLSGRALSGRVAVKSWAIRAIKTIMEIRTIRMIR